MDTRHHYRYQYNLRKKSQYQYLEDKTVFSSIRVLKYYSLENTWTAVADLPVGLNSHKMELLDGLPTIVGGYNGKTQNGILYQYHVNLNQWIPHPDAEMRIPRSSPAVFQVPRHLFPSCFTEN